jgi:hypothetical protein
MIQNPAYYRDLLNQILHEDDDDDIPNPPSRSEIKSQQFLRRVASKDVKYTCTIEDNDVSFHMEDVSYGLPDGHIVVSLFASTRANMASATVEPPYLDMDNHPYPDTAVEAEITHIFTIMGFDVQVGFSEHGMQDGSYLHFDADISPETEEIWRKIAEEQANNA